MKSFHPPRIHIPLDLQRLILDLTLSPSSRGSFLLEPHYSSTPSYSSLSLVSRSWYHWVNLVLYQSVYLGSPKKAASFLDSLERLGVGDDRDAVVAGYWSRVRSIQLEGCSVLSRLGQENVVGRLLVCCKNLEMRVEELDLTTDCRIKVADLPTGLHSFRTQWLDLDWMSLSSLTFPHLTSLSVPNLWPSFSPFSPQTLFPSLESLSFFRPTLQNAYATHASTLETLLVLSTTSFFGLDNLPDLTKCRFVLFDCIEICRGYIGVPIPNLERMPRTLRWLRFDFIGDMEGHSFRPLLTALVQNKRKGGSCEGLEEIWLPFEMRVSGRLTSKVSELENVVTALGLKIVWEKKREDAKRRIRGQDGLVDVWRVLQQRLKREEQERRRRTEEGSTVAELMD